jgi:hypothetical protein
MIGVDLMNFKGQTALVTIDFYSGYITYDVMENETTDQVITKLNQIFQKFGLVEEIYSDNGPCFKSDKFSMFCQALEIAHQTSSPHYHQSMGRVERAIQTVKQILKRSKTILDVTCGLITYHDTPINDLLPSPAELFFGRRINTRLGLMCAPQTMTDTQKMRLSEQRSAHLKTSRQQPDEYTPDQPVWFTEDGSTEWKPAIIISRDPHPDSYWIYNPSSNQRIRRNRHDLKPRYATTIRPHITSSDEDISPAPTYAEADPQPACESSGTTPDDTNSMPAVTPRTSRYGRTIKDNRHPDYVY